MFFPGHINMAQQMKKCAEISNTSLLNLHKQIFKSASLDPKNLGRVSMSGRKLLMKLVYSQRN
jgi:hypothetical protein